MAALTGMMSVVDIDCPACGETLPMMVRADPVPGPGPHRTLELAVEVDYKPAQDHIDQHLAQAG